MRRTLAAGVEGCRLGSSESPAAEPRLAKNIARTVYQLCEWGIPDPRKD